MIKMYKDIYPDITKLPSKFHSYTPKKEELAKEVKRITYPQVWSAYNLAQTSEKVMFIDILDELLSYIPEKAIKRRGRPSTPLKEAIFFMCVHSYSGLSSRRSISDIKLASQRNHIERDIHFNSLLNFYKDKRITDILKKLIVVSALPLKQFETEFTIDASGFSTYMFERWMLYRNSRKVRRKFMKINIVSGTRTNVITAVDIKDGYDHECKYFIPLLRDTMKNFKVETISADKGYLSADNISFAMSSGVLPLIPFRKNCVVSSKNPEAWKQAYKFFSENYDEFKMLYGKRQNSECVFSMIKRKYGIFLRTKSMQSRVNELLIKCLIHNVCVLIQEVFERKAEPEFEPFAQIFN